VTRFDLIVAASSVSPKETGGDDRVRTFGRGSGPTGVIVCDGVGSVPGSAEMAEEASELGAALLSGENAGEGVWALDRRLEANLPADREGATTCTVVCADGDGVVGHLLVGNGAVLEVMPMELEPGRLRLLWTSVVLPQMGGRDGRPALRSFLPPPDGHVEAEKGVRWIPAGQPRLYLACSDGFLSEEDRGEGPAPDGSVWRQVPALAARLLERLTAEWADLMEEDAEEATARLAAALEEVLGDEPSDGSVLDDDTSVGALLLRPAPAEETR